MTAVAYHPRRDSGSCRIDSGPFFVVLNVKVHLAVVKNDQVLLLNSGCEMNNCCIFANSRHVDINQFKGSFYDRAVQGDGIFSVRDLVEAPVLRGVDEKIVEEGIRSMMVAPLRFQGQLIGALEVGSPNPDDFGPGEELVLSQILPIFSMAVNRSLDELENRIDAVIKEQCTAIHPSVEWRFRKAALRHLEHLGDSELSGMDPIVFKDVFPLYGASDIRGSSELRNRAIQSDLVEHLCLALDIVHAAAEFTSMPIINELSFRTERQLEMVRNWFGDRRSNIDLEVSSQRVGANFPTAPKFRSSCNRSGLRLTKGLWIAALEWFIASAKISSEVFPCSINGFPLTSNTKRLLRNQLFLTISTSIRLTEWIT